jgi:hypothetical protein
MDTTADEATRRTAGAAQTPLAWGGPDLRFAEWRAQDLNLRPSGYEQLFRPSLAFLEFATVC